MNGLGVLVVGDLQGGQALLGRRQLLAEPGLFFAGDVVRYRAAHRLLGPLASFPLDDFDPGLQLCPPVGGRLGVIVQVGEQPVANARGLLFREVLAAPLLQHESIDRCFGQVGQVAAVLVAVPAVAEPVGVRVTTPSRGNAVDELAVAVAAVQRSGQVVLASVGPFPGLPVGGDHVLHSGPGFWFGEAFVFAIELDALPGDGALVVRVVQHLAEFFRAERPGDAFSGRPLRQSADLELGGELAQAPLAGGVGVEGEPDQGCPFRVKFDGADFDAIHDVADVEVADRGETGGAAGLDLLGHAFDDFGGEVAAVELVDRPQDAVQQHAGWCLVDVFDTRDEGGSGFPDGQMQLHVVEPVAGQPVELVHDDVLDRVLAQERQHLLQVFPVGRASRFTGVLELGHHHRIE